MTKKIIVADDSQTIQKVIKISFASKGYELIPCLSESELFNNLKNDVDLILLDFSLSEVKSGYDLAKSLREKSKAPILALLGTFDSVDESTFLNSGFSDKIVKPFETEKFLKKCETLMLSLEKNSDSDLDMQELTEVTNDSEYGDWDIKSPEIDDASIDEEISSHEENIKDTNNSKLDMELGGWGFDKSDLVARDLTNEFDIFPPVIEKSNDIATKFLSANSLVQDEEVHDDSEQDSYLAEEDHQDKTSEIVLNDIFEQEEKDISFNEDDVDALDFWSVDESNSFEETAAAQVETIEAVEKLEEPLEFNYKVSIAEKNEFSNDEMMNAIKNDIAPIVEKYVKQYCEANIEKIMWEIIPDLAENIIRKEIKEISKNIQASIDN